jgi:hypothetical protein
MLASFQGTPAPVPDQRARLQSVVVMSIDIEASSIDNWREVGGSFEWVIGPGSWYEPGLKGDFSPGLCHEPGLKGHGALVPAVR